MIIALFILLWFGWGDFLLLFDCKRLSNHNYAKYPFVVKNQSLPLFEGVYALIYLSMFYFIFDFMVEYFYIAKKWENIITCGSRLQLLMIYTWLITLNLFIIYNRNQYVHIAIIMIGLRQLTNFILTIGDILTYYKQNTYYLLYSAGYHLYYP